MSVTAKEIADRVKGRLDQIEPGLVDFGEIYLWEHAVLLEIFPKMLPFTQWYESRVIRIAEWSGKSSEAGLLTGGNTIVGFTGLTVNECQNWNAYIKHQNGKFYIDQVASNGVDYIVLVGASSLPDSGLVTCIVSQASSATLSEIDLSSLDYYNVFKIVGPSGIIPKAKNADELDMMAGETAKYPDQIRWWELGRRIIFALGIGASYPTSTVVWYNHNPVKAMGTNNLDMPNDWENRLIAGVMSIAAGKLKNVDEAARLRNEAQAILAEMEKASLQQMVFEEKGKEG